MSDDIELNEATKHAVNVVIEALEIPEGMQSLVWTAVKFGYINGHFDAVMEASNELEETK